MLCSIIAMNRLPKVREPVRDTRNRTPIDATGFASWRTRTRRRLLAAGLTGALLTAAVFGQIDSALGATVTLAALLCGLAAYLFLRHVLRGIIDIADDELDELQRMRKDRYYMWSYRVLGVVVAVGIPAALAIRRLAGLGSGLPYTEVAGLMPVLIMTVATVPAIVAGWLEPDEPT